MAVHYIVGPPGCGKTTHGAKICQRAVEENGDHAVLALSLTNAAANEIGGRDTGLHSDMIGTMHSCCFRAIGPKTVATDPRLVKIWNEEFSEYAMSKSADGTSMDIDDLSMGANNETLGDQLYANVNLKRHQMIEEDRWGDDDRLFHKYWTDFKRNHDAVDFTDMIEIAVNDIPSPPGAPSILIADEAQDFSKLELTLLRKWNRYVDDSYLIYDPAQALYAWRGSSRGMADVEPTQVLSQSYRVPVTVQALAMNVIRRAPSYRPALYNPRKEVGSVDYEPWTADFPASWVEQLDDPFHGSTMVIATCNYMLDRIIGDMRRRGIAYHNPYAPKRWNPLRLNLDGKHTAVERALAFAERKTKPCYSKQELTVLANSLLKSALNEGWEDALDALPEHPDINDMLRAELYVMNEDAQDAAQRGDLWWYEKNLTKANRTAAAYPVAIITRSGGTKLLREVATAKKPVTGAVTIGTVHSVKGGEADRVVVFPDISGKGLESMKKRTWEHHDGVIRTFYVACTRARKSLVIGSPQSEAYSVSL